MPCYDGGYPPTEEEKLSAKAEAILCAVIRAHGPHIFDGLDFKEAGVSRKDCSAWWKMHQARDKERLARELEVKKREARYREIVGELTPEDKEILGIK